MDLSEAKRPRIEFMSGDPDNPRNLRDDGHILRGSVEVNPDDLNDPEINLTSGHLSADVTTSRVGTEIEISQVRSRPDLETVQIISSPDVTISQVDSTSDTATSQDVIGDLNRAILADSQTDLVDSSLTALHDTGVCDTPGLQLDWDTYLNRSPRLLTKFGLPSRAQDKQCFFKGVKWSPDGTCMVTCAEDNYLRVFNLPQSLSSQTLEDIPPLDVVFKIHEAETVYDFCWMPTMDSSIPETCGLLTTSRDSPVHLWDGFTGKLNSTYRTHNHLDELECAMSLAVTLDGSKLYCGFQRCLRVFDVEHPGRSSEVIKTEQSGILSTLAFNPGSERILAAGSYNRTVGLYDVTSARLFLVLDAQLGGVTLVKFSPDGNLLFSGGRKDHEVLVWDIRKSHEILHTFERNVTTNQRIYFDLEQSGDWLLSGNCDGFVSVFSTSSGARSLHFQASSDCINGLSFHPTMPIFATTSGQRHFDDLEVPSNDLGIWWCGHA